ncbi:PhoH family protein [Candidatus Babeliales bacterium]|nr:PhoH family protein [Candidatus Babeliales bacterium]
MEETKKSIQRPIGNGNGKECPIRLNRIFVLDTNVLLHDPKAIFAFKGVVIGIPFVVLEELDGFKKEIGEKGHNAREVIRTLDNLRSQGSLLEGVELKNGTEGAILRVFPTPEKVDFSQALSSLSEQTFKDNLIIQTVQDLSNQNCEVTLVTKDINSRVKADVLGLDAEDYTRGQITYDSYYKGWIEMLLPAKDLKDMTTNKVLSLVSGKDLSPNEYIILESENNPENNRLFRYLGGKQCKEIAPITILHSFQARNIQQLMALDLLMDDNIKIVSLLGPAGTGKTFLTLLAGLFKVAYEKEYRKLMVARPIVALGADVGYLPGDIQEKLHMWMQPVHDNLEFISSELMRGNEEDLQMGRERERERKPRWRKGKHHEREREQNHQQKRYQDMHFVEKLVQKGILSLEAITYMRGRSIPYQYVFIDEVQNLTPHEVKTLVSRAGQGTKVILAGDPFQIDSPYLDFTSNGLTVTTDKLKGSSLFGTAFLEKSERSELAQLAADVL